MNTGENSLATDFSREGLGNIDTDEVDPIAKRGLLPTVATRRPGNPKDASIRMATQESISSSSTSMRSTTSPAFETVAPSVFGTKGQGEIWQRR